MLSIIIPVRREGSYSIYKPSGPELASSRNTYKRTLYSSPNLLIPCGVVCDITAFDLLKSYHGDCMICELSLDILLIASTLVALLVYVVRLLLSRDLCRYFLDIR